MLRKLGQEQLAQFFEAQPLVENRGMFEGRARRDRLERLQEAAALRKIEILGDRPRPGLIDKAVVLPEAQGRAEHRAGFRKRGELDQMWLPVRADARDDAVGRSEIEADRIVHSAVLFGWRAGG